MRAFFLLGLLLACNRPGACGLAPSEPAEVVEADLVEPQMPPWAHAWSWAVVVRVEPGRAAATVVEVPAAAGVAAPLPEDGQPLPLDLSLVRDGLAGRPVALARAAPGQQVEVVVGDGPDAGSLLPVEIPAWPGSGGAEAGAVAVEGGEAPADEEVRWLVATDRGVHWLQWDEAYRVREVEVALGIQPWRVIIDADRDRDLGEADAAGAQASDELDEASAADALRSKLLDYGIVVLQAPEDGQPLAVPWADAPLGQVDVHAVLRAAGKGSGWVVAQAGQEPTVLPSEAPIRMLERASAYFAVQLVPPRAGRGVMGGPEDRGEGRPEKQGKGKAGRPGRGEAREGKVGKRPGRGPGARGDRGRPERRPPAEEQSP